MFKFGLVSLKTICYLMAALIVAGGVILLIATITFRTKWQNGNLLGQLFTSSMDLAFYLSIVIICIAIIGFIGICLCKPKILWAYVILLTILIPVLIVAGFYLYCDSYSSNSVNSIRINSVMRALSPIKLDLMQRTYHCCGIEKYTDFIVMWSMWGMNYSNFQYTTMGGKFSRPDSDGDGEVYTVTPLPFKRKKTVGGKNTYI